MRAAGAVKCLDAAASRKLSPAARPGRRIASSIPSSKPLPNTPRAWKPSTIRLWSPSKYVTADMHRRKMDRRKMDRQKMGRRRTDRRRRNDRARNEGTREPRGFYLRSESGKAFARRGRTHSALRRSRTCPARQAPRYSALCLFRDRDSRATCELSSRVLQCTPHHLLFGEG